MKYGEIRARRQRRRDAEAEAAALRRERERMEREAAARARQGGDGGDGAGKDDAKNGAEPDYNPNEILTGFGILCIITIFAILISLTAAHFGE